MTDTRRRWWTKVVGDVERIYVPYEADADGVMDRVLPDCCSGIIDRVTYKPQVNTPVTANIYIYDRFNVDVLEGLGAGVTVNAGAGVIWPYRDTAGANRHQEVFVKPPWRLNIGGFTSGDNGIICIVLLTSGE